MTFITRRFAYNFAPLLVMLLVVQLASPFIERSALAASIVMILLLLTCVPAVQPSRGVRLVAIGGFAITVAARLASFQIGADAGALHVASLVVTVIYAAFITQSVFWTVIRANRVSANTVVGAVCVYLMLAHIFGLMYLVLEVSSPGSIVGPGVHLAAGNGLRTPPLHDFLYFSVITLATLGYGDMVPTSDAARGLVMLEAMCGQFFVAVFVARLVGSLGSGQQSRNEANE